MTLKAGDQAPDFELKNQNGKSVRLSKLAGKKLVIYFYPQDDTPTCTTEACNLRDNYKALQKAGYIVFGISPDSEKKHLKFIQKYKLPFDLLADEGHKIAELYGVWGKKTLFGITYMGILRTTFLVDDNGVIEEVISNVKSKEHATQILKS